MLTTRNIENITGDTLDENLVTIAGLNAARRRLAEAAEDATPDTITKAANDVQQAAGALWALAHYRDALSLGADRAEAAATLAWEALRIDDTWSGRGNDGRRAYHDGVVAVAQHARFVRGAR